ncbi:YfcL family protein [Thalassotalea ponticola]|uniref:YfcL family protein n=1 Tax=Thalassotalea ponticola TaxID=1523392 RepID=UPI0025B42376|nr:YfcL family protein [Thalassotalea ponticola]MDN3653907.1 YfcL family protein [Thalassotalea ponticola]
MIAITDIKTLAQLDQYFDHIVDLDNDDALFASSYLRGFIEVEAVEFGDEQQPLTQRLADKVSAQLERAKDELSSADQRIVEQFWQTLQPAFN